MRSHEEQRKQPTPYRGSRQEVAVKPQGTVGAPSSSSAQVDPSSREDYTYLLERMLEGNNLRLAYKRVKQNGGAPGVDGVTVETLQEHLWEHWERVKTQLLTGTYKPMPVRRVGNPQIRRRRTVIGNPDRNGSLHPAGSPTSHDPHL